MLSVKSAEPTVSEPAEPLLVALVCELLEVGAEEFALLLEHAASVAVRRIGNVRAASTPWHLRFMVLLRG